ncbi:MAG: hypothetical protein HBSAPP02_17800 [Phycisphaerae bacterium]|nr:MAG: hypothetical protein HRU71_02465 [Planctomycetia bacterium]RIK70047.1 MAG: hypothetical protein DCC66_06675 [Planctomycetota bacterium]GJQ26748.1 MAG: hypothetical protein HBSAPP02_17800 [Phycisphaerae bacterium]
MSFEEKGEGVIAALDGEELKLIYRVLHQHLGEHPELMDTDFLIELQNHLQRKARADGVDISDHGAWDRWIGNDDAPSCDLRNVRRRKIE